jgi:hypothetical protein
MILSSFNSVDELNGYLKNSMNHQQIIHIDSVEKLFCLENINEYLPKLKSLASGEITLDQFNTEINTVLNATGLIGDYVVRFVGHHLNSYVYPWSKTIYRRTVHADVPDSLYKKMYNLLKDKEYIINATGSYVTLVPTTILSEDFENVFLNTTISEKTLQTVFSYVQEISDDKSFYLQKIESLQSKIAQLETINDNLNSQLLNKTLTTWY